MNFVLRNLPTKAAIVIGNIFIATVVNVKPSQAASFKFTLSPTYVGTNEGSLSFSGSPQLKGVGLETANLSDLTDASFSLNYTTVLPLGGGGPQLASGFSFSNPTFDFNNGNLIGIDGYSSVPIDVGDGRLFPTVIETKGFAQLTLSGARFADSLSGVSTTTNLITGQTNTIVLGPLTYLTGNISFETIVPVSTSTSVPEPSNAIGLVVASGLQAFGQQKLSQKGRYFKVKTRFQV